MSTIKKEIKTMNSIIDEMSELYFSLKNDKTSIRKAGEMANMAGKVIGATKINMMAKILSIKEKSVDGKIKIVNPKQGD